MPDTQKIFNLIQSWGEFLKKSGDLLPDPVSQLQKEALKMTCRIHAKYPYKLLQLFPWNRAYMRGLCDGVGIPIPEPSPPPTGGQCVGVQYAAWGDGITQVNPGSGNNVPLTGQGLMTRLTNIPLLPGAITRVQYINQNGLPVSLEKYLSDGKTFNKPTYLWIYHSGANSPHIVTFVNSWGQIIREWRRSDNLPDNCGNAPPVYSNDPPIDPSDFTKTVNIYNYNTDGSIKFTIPVTITIPIDINGGFDFDFSVGGTSVHFDMGGLNFGGTLNVGGGTTNNYTTNNYGGNGNNTGTEFKPEDLNEEPVPDADKELKKPGIKWAKVVVTKLPDRGKRLVDSDSSNVDHFAGFFSWTIDNGGICRMDEFAIRKRRYIFPAPMGATGVKYYPVNGAILSVSVFTTK